MEHRLITGGGEYLPFARSCVAKLKKLGLPYADQSYSVGSATIRVRIEPGHEYIHIEGGGGNVLSGIVRDGFITGEIGDQKPYISTFKPTRECWSRDMRNKPVSGGPTKYNDNEQLAVSTQLSTVYAPSLSQPRDVIASMYTGRMAGVVQFLLGCGHLSATDYPDGLVIKYDCVHRRTHGITMGADGKPWLIEISEDRGVLAMPLPKDDLKKVKVSSSSITREIIKSVGYIPSGETFPEGTELDEAVASGDVLALMSVSELSSLFSKDPSDERIGWSFNKAGSEAHNIVFFIDTESYSGGIYKYGFPAYTAAHYKFTFVIGEMNNERLPGQPIATGSAELVLVEKKLRFGHSEDMNMYSPRGYIADRPLIWAIPLPNAGGYFFEDEYPTQWPIFVCHINDVVEVVRIEGKLVKYTGGLYNGPLDYARWICATSPHCPDPGGEVFYSQTDDPGIVVIPYSSDIPIPPDAVIYQINGIAVNVIQNRNDDAFTYSHQTVFNPAGARDCYVMMSRVGTTKITTERRITYGFYPSYWAPSPWEPPVPPSYGSFTEETMHGEVRKIVLPNGEVLVTEYPDWRTTETLPFGPDRTEEQVLADTIYTSDEVPTQPMARDVNGQYWVIVSMLGRGTTAAYNYGRKQMYGDYYLYVGFEFNGVPMPITGYSRFTFVGYV